MSKIRFATLEDLPRLVEIYNQAIAAQNATADLVPYTVEQRRGWFEQHRPEEYPIYVHEDGHGLVTGYLSLSPYRNRPALGRTAEVSYYVDYAHHGEGTGTRLMQHMLADVPRTGKKVLLAILLAWNSTSIRLLEKFGFEKWGTMLDAAEFNGKTCDHLYYGKKV